MALLDLANYQDPLDILRRFTPTPLRTRFCLAAASVAVETNDFSLLPALPLETASGEIPPVSLYWKLVRDPDARGFLQEPLVLLSGQLTIVAMGAACLLGMDQERRELLCFIGGDVDPRTFQEFLVPFLCQLSTQALETPAPEYAADLSEDFADA
ncbi:MAG: hypothetical protein ACHQT6_00665 [Candidatus Acidiferrales bacterium]